MSTRTRKTRNVDLASLTLTARQLAKAVAVVKPHTARGGDWHPMLSAYRLEVHRGDLYVIVTDRYSLAAWRVERDKEQTFPAGFAVSFPIGVVEQALAMFRPPRSSRLAVETLRFGYVVDPGTARVVYVENVATVTSTLSARLSSEEPRGFPAAWKLLGEIYGAAAEAKSAPSSYTLAGSQLAKFANLHALTGYEPTFRAYNGNKALAVTAGESFAAAVMPCKVPSDGDTFAAWLDLLRSTTAGAKAATA